MGKGDKKMKIKGKTSKQRRSVTDLSVTKTGNSSAYVGKKGKLIVEEENEFNRNQDSEGEEIQIAEFESEDEANINTADEDDTIENTPAVRQIDTESTENSVIPETVEEEAENEDAKKKYQNKGKGTFASLFADNRKVVESNKLQHFEAKKGVLQITESNISEEASEWSNCLVGYFAGRFPGRGALQQIVSSWKVKVTTLFHNSGWLIFKFEKEKDQLQVIQEGPYMIYGRPLLMKIMPRFFKFDNEELSKFPVWVQLRNLPLELWSNLTLGMICSQIGKPIYTDKLTSSKERISFARVLVEIDVSKELVRNIEMALPNGEILNQEVVYENPPKFCAHCKRVGHDLGSCRLVGKVSINVKHKNNVAGGDTLQTASREEDFQLGKDNATEADGRMAAAETRKMQLNRTEAEATNAGTTTAITNAAGPASKEIETGATVDNAAPSQLNQCQPEDHATGPNANAASPKLNRQNTKQNAEAEAMHAETAAAITNAAGSALFGATVDNAGFTQQKSCDPETHAAGLSAKAVSAKQNQQITKQNAGGSKLKAIEKEKKGDVATEGEWKTHKKGSKAKMKIKESKVNNEKISAARGLTPPKH